MFGVLIIAAVASGAYLLARHREPRGAAGPPPPPPTAPTSAPKGRRLQPSALGLPAAGSDYGVLWEMTRFGVEVYPSDANGRHIRPPDQPDGISSDPNCTIVAVGDLWWDRVRGHAQAMRDRGTNPAQIRSAILGFLAPQCLDAPGAGAAMLAQEIDERLNLVLGPPALPGQSSLVMNPGRGRPGRRGRRRRTIIRR